MADPRETGGKRMTVDLPTMWKDMQVGQSPILTEEALQSVIKAGNLVVISNWATDVSAKRVTDKNEVLRMPHRLVFLTVPFIDDKPHSAPEGVKPCYYLMELALADRYDTPGVRQAWEKKERHQLYLLGINDSTSQLSQDLIQALFPWKGRLRSAEMDHVFRVEANGILSFQIDFNYPPFALPTEQKRFDLTAIEDGDEVRLIKVDDEETRELAKKIVDLNSMQSEPQSKLF